MRHRFIVTALAIGFLALASAKGRGAEAATNSVDETAIRTQIASYDAGNRGLYLPDDIFWSGAFKRPTVGNEKPEPTSTDGIEGERVKGSTKTKTTPVRIVVSGGHDLAYEYSDATLAYDLKDGKHVSFDTALLRVWQKQGGEWKIAAFFVHPLEK